MGATVQGQTDGKLKITFTPNVENPAINGIEIFSEDSAAAAQAAPAER
jgi:hypothetical protein